jgi:hypothetical protein
MLQIVYVLLCIFGFLLQNGLDLSLLIDQLFVNSISSFFGLDVVISAIVLLVFIVHEGTRLGIKNLWIYITSTLLVGVSFGLPLFLLRRQYQLDSAMLSNIPKANL